MGRSSYQRAASVQGSACVDFAVESWPIGASSYVAPDLPITTPWVFKPEPDSNPVYFLKAHNLVEVGLCHSGSGVLFIEDRILPFAAGDICFIGPDEGHMSRSPKSSRSVWSYFWFDPATLLANLPGSLEMTDLEGASRGRFPAIISPGIAPEICRTVATMITELRDKPPGYQMGLTSLAGLLMVMLHRTFKPQAAPARLLARANMSRISPALNHLARHYTEEVDIRELAELCHVSLSQFRRLFVSTVGVPPLQYLVRIRIRMAASILRSQPEKSILEVASEVGFDAINTFNRNFLLMMGAPPREWRKRSLAVCSAPE